MQASVSLCVMVLVVGGAALPRNIYRSFYVVPGAADTDDEYWSQFQERSGNGYSYGYEYPGRVHYESKDGEANVKGFYGYVDVYGNPIVVNYESKPQVGFTAAVGTAEELPQPSVGPASQLFSGLDGPVPAVAEGEAEPIVYAKAEAVSSNLSPLLKQAADTGNLIPIGTSLSDTPQYAVSPELVERAGGVSALAYSLGAVPVAAVHDVQARPGTRNTDSAFAPVLVHHEQPHITLYTLEVPDQ